MGIISAAINSVGGVLADSYLEAYRPSKIRCGTGYLC